MAQDRRRPEHAQAAQVAVALLGDGAEPPAVVAGPVPGDDAALGRLDPRLGVPQLVGEGADRVNLKDALGKIETDGANLNGGRLRSFVALPMTTTLWHTDAEKQGPSTPSGLALYH